MTTDELTIHLTADRFAELTRAAQVQGKTLDELADEAIAMLPRKRRLEELMDYGHRRAQELGIREEDVDRLIHEGRAENKACRR